MWHSAAKEIEKGEKEMSKIYDNVNMHFDDVFVIYSKDCNGNGSSTDYIYFDEDDAQEMADVLNREAHKLGYHVCTLTEFVWILNNKC